MRPSEPTGAPPSHNSGPTDTPCEPAGEPPAQPRRPDDDGKGERPTVTLVPNLKLASTTCSRTHGSTEEGQSSDLN